MTIPIDHREELKKAGAAQTAFAKGGIGKVLLIREFDPQVVLGAGRIGTR